jgi:hypothetical protein
MATQTAGPRAPGKHGQKRRHKAKPRAARKKLAVPGQARPRPPDGLFTRARKLLSPRPLIASAGGFALTLFTDQLSRRP